ncbi:MAG: HEAT repeat domain-containing protein [Phycisphaerales bacterium]|jgi:HEAT repeat protein
MNVGRLNGLLAAGWLLGALTGCAADRPGTAPGEATKPAPTTGAVGTFAVTPTTTLPPPEVRELSQIAQSQLRERAIEAVQAAAKSPNPQIRANAVEAAGLAAVRLSKIIDAGLSDESPAVRTVAALSVGREHLVDLADHASLLLQDPSPHVKAAAIFAMAKCGLAVDQTPLATMLLRDPSPWVRRNAAFILGEMGNPSAMPLLRAAARQGLQGATPEQTKNFELQLDEAMVKLGDSRAREAIRAALYPSRPEELEATVLAIQIIGTTKDQAAIDQLIHLADYADPKGQQYPPEIRLAIAGTLAQVGLPKGDFVVEEYVADASPGVRAQAAWAYGYIASPKAISRLDGLLNDAEDGVRIAAAAGVLRAVK